MKRYLKNYIKLLRSHRTMTVFATLTALAFVVFASSVTIVNVQRQRAAVFETQSETEEEVEEEAEEYLRAERIERAQKEAFADLEILAESVVVFDIASKETIFEKEARVAKPLASITKVMSMITASDILAPEETVVVDSEALATEGDSGLLVGEEWAFKEISDLALIASSNDAAVAVAKAAGGHISSTTEGEEATPIERFIVAMNEKAAEIGLEKAQFYNVSGLDLNHETEPGAVASARDVARLFSYALAEYPEVIEHTRFGDYTVSSLTDRRFEVENTNELARPLPGLLASKTGYTLQAGGNLAVVADVGFLRPVVIVVLGSTHDGRFSDVETLYRATKQYFANI